MSDLLIFDDVIEEVEDNESQYENIDSYYSDLFNSDIENDNDAELVGEESEVNVSDESHNFVSSDLSSDNVSNDQIVSMNYVPVPVSGNSIKNYYISVSGNDASLSYNLLNKPLNSYSVSESILLFIFMGLFVAGFSWFIKKNVFKL